MGLDMYLSKRLYLPSYDGNEKEGKKSTRELTVIQHPTVDMSGVSVTSITAEAMYWRKANAVHKWFVDNVQKGEDDCKEYYVTLDQLKQLLAMAEMALESARNLANGEGDEGDHPSDYLPTQAGFFFGDTEYGEWYIEDMEYTVKGLTELILNDNGEWNYYYQSSW